MGALRGHAAGAGLLVVTHDPGMLEGAARILHLSDGRLAD
jgi:ABC-type lipoprotein export system ATPase subunit